MGCQAPGTVSSSLLEFLSPFAVLLLQADQEDDIPALFDGNAEVEGLPAAQGVERGDLRD